MNGNDIFSMSPRRRLVNAWHASAHELIYVSIPILVLIWIILIHDPLNQFEQIFGMPEISIVSVIIFGDILRDVVEQFSNENWLKETSRNSGLVFGIGGITLSASVVGYSYGQRFGLDNPGSAKYRIFQTVLLILGLVVALVLKQQKHQARIAEMLSKASQSRPRASAP